MDHFKTTDQFIKTHTSFILTVKKYIYRLYKKYLKTILLLKNDKLLWRFLYSVLVGIGWVVENSSYFGVYRIVCRDVFDNNYIFLVGVTY